MTNTQRDKIATAMDRYLLFEKTKVSVFTSIDIENVKKVRQELGKDYEFCKTCLDEVVSYMKNTFETIWQQ